MGDGMKPNLAAKTFEEVIALAPGAFAAHDLAYRKWQEAEWQALATLPLPNRFVEYWKYSDLNRLLANVRFTKANLTAAAFPEVKQAICFDYVHIPDLPQGVSLQPLSASLASERETYLSLLRTSAPKEAVFAKLSAALAEQIWVLKIADGMICNLPIHLLATLCEQAAATCLLVIVGQQAEVTLLDEVHAEMQASALMSQRLLLTLGQGAKCRWFSIGHADDGLTHFQHLQAYLGQDACLETFVQQTGGRISRQNIHVDLLGVKASSHHYGYYDLKGKSHVDNQLLIAHKADQTYSNQLYKGLVGGQSRAVFRGKAVVHAGIKGIVAHQQNHNLLLSDMAEVDTKPDLEIYSDEVQCSHGATVGALDRQALFYLLARGIPEPVAEAMLRQAFLTEVLDHFAMLPPYCKAFIPATHHYAVAL